MQIRILLLKEYSLVFLLFIFSGLLFLHFTGTLYSGYHFMDDHVHITLKQQLNSKHLSFTDVIYNSTFKLDFDPSRFRPFYWFLIVLQTHLMQLNYFHYAIFMGIMGAVAATLVYGFGRALRFTIADSIFLVLLCFIGQQTEIWWMNGPAESRGIIFYAAGLICLVQSSKQDNNIWLRLAFCLFISLAAYCKESYALTIPALILFKIYLQKYYAPNFSWIWIVRHNLIEGITLSAVLASVLFFVRLKNPSLNIGYAGVSEQTGVKEYLHTFFNFVYQENLLIVWLLQILFIGGLLFYYIESSHKLLNEYKRLLIMYLPLFFLTILFILPQVVIYTKSSFTGRYFLPVMVPVSVLLIVPIRYMRNYWLDAIGSGKLIKTISNAFLMAFVLYFLVLKYKIAYTAGSNFYSFGKEINTFLNSIINNTPKDGNIILIYNPVHDIEAIVSLPAYVNIYKKKPNKIYNLSLQDAGDSLKISERGRKIASVVLFDYRAEEQFLISSKDWFDPHLFTRRLIGRYIHYYSIQ